jgi:two-component SAPR family response regulator
MEDIPCLRIVTLGQFALWRNEEQLPDSIWKRGKAKELFKYLITHPSRFIAKERIVFDLWPQLPPERALRDFKAAFTALNTALQPNRAARQLAPYVTSQANSYGLNPTAPIELDYLAAERLLIAAEQHKDIAGYRAALTQMQGDYLPDAIYQDWTVSTRERMTTLFLTGATRLAGLLTADDHPIEAALWCQRVLERDACWEEAYRLLMRSYWAQGNRPKVKTTFQICQQTLADELELEPMPETVQYYQQAMR